MLFEVDEAATRVREEVDADANVIVGATFDERLEGIVHVSVVATGIDNLDATRHAQSADSLAELADRLCSENHHSVRRIERSAPRPQLRSPAFHLDELPAEQIPEYPRQATARGLDPYGRFAAVRNSIEQVVLDIPAFLGRKVS
jgi:cell division protein FtsZ